MKAISAWFLKVPQSISQTAQILQRAMIQGWLACTPSTTGRSTLAGTPAKPGIYDISVTITDELGRTATSNTLPFRIYSGEETLQDQLTLANCTKTADGKYMYDMEPWAIKNFTLPSGDQTGSRSRRM